MLITEAYKQQNAELHKSNTSYGTSGHIWRDKVRQISSYGRMPILDFGCGKATLAKSLGPAYMVTNYDPAIEGLDTTPEPHPIVVCGDVLEHVEPELIDNVMAELYRLTGRKLMAVIHLRPAIKKLPDGRNTHLILQPPDWWKAKFTEHGFRILETKQDKGTPPAWLMVVAERAFQ